MKVILASQSPRRRELLCQMGLNFEVIPSSFEEPWDKAADPGVFALESAHGKALDVLHNLSKYNEKKSISGQSPENIQKSRVKINQEVIVIGADTVVTMDKVIYGKPDNHDQAREMLKGLSGRSHKVITGFAVLCPAGNIEITGTEETKVTFAELSDHEIERYIASGEPMDKAGAYGIQGRASIFVSSIKGCYFNVVGLPIRRIYESIIKIDPGLISF